jgi:glycosyltransferase involved in cell wall biosynthesis
MRIATTGLSTENVSCSTGERRAISRCWHIISSEYPPQTGGVSDYTALVAHQLAAAGDQVHVWCPPCAEADEPPNGVVLHRELGAFRPKDLRRTGAELDRFPSPRHILVQWVPHGYGYRSMNVPLCQWLLERSRRHGDHVEIMVHEPYLRFRMSSPRQSLAALVHRFMTLLLLAAAERVWISTPAWEGSWRPYALGRNIPFGWLPVPSTIAVADIPGAVQTVRERCVPSGEILIGHLGTYGDSVISILEPVLIAVAGLPGRRKVLLMGQGSTEYRRELVRKNQALESLVVATGALGAMDLSHHIMACDLLLQPYPDGVTSRRTSCMAGLSHGKPVITNLGALSERFWKESGALVLAPSPETQFFVDLLRTMEANREERERLGRAARQLYEERFDISQTVAALREPAVF